MGCEQSKTAGPPPALNLTNHNSMRSTSNRGSATRSKQRPKGVGATERMISNRNKKFQLAQGLETSPEEEPKIKLKDNGQMMQEEVVKRTNSSLVNSNATLGKGEKGNVIHVQYAYWTQRGYYPDDPHKANQDDYSITLQFAGDEADALFAVYDGHGAKGHDCAKYAKKKLPHNIAKYIRQARVKSYQAELKKAGQSLKGSYKPHLWPVLSAKEYEVACRKGFMETNKKMHEDATVDDKLSGTTAITAGFHMGRLTVSNVGDSRAVLGHRMSSNRRGLNDDEEEKTEIGMEVSPANGRGRLVAVPLSSDQTPYRKDERERCHKAGASIMSIDQMEGDEPIHDNWGDMILGEDIDEQGDPPRVWVKDKDYPGCAFTRSIGDRLADGIGVHAEPEMLTTELSSKDEILVIASDGVFEFLTNQAVIDLCSDCETPLSACETVVKAAYDQWLVHEDRTDDITIVVCFLNVSGNPPVGTTTDELVKDGKISIAGQKPIRISGRKNKTTASNLSMYGNSMVADSLDLEEIKNNDLEDVEA